jgi:hypothetical protein
MKTSLETSKQLGMKRTVTHKVESTGGIYAKTPFCDSRITQKAAVEAELKKAEAITILMRSSRIY